MLRWREFALTLRRCPFCGVSVIVRLRRDELGVRCLRCGGSTVHVSLGWVVRRHLPDLGKLDVCELSARGPFVAYLRRSVRSLAISEYFADLTPGAIRDGVRCEDVQCLTYPDASFDLITHTEVLEHVPDDGRAFAELYRVLRPGGHMFFTVPLRHDGATQELAALRDGTISYFAPPTYHHDPLRGDAGILVFRDYSNDIIARLTAAGFARAWIEPPGKVMPWGYGRAVVCASRD